MRLVDRTRWPKGEWDNEPDRVEWRVGDYYCLVNRVGGVGDSYNPGHLCGYVGVVKGHKWYKKAASKLEERYGISVHGGVTYASQWKEDDDVPTDLWMVGFECAHAGDVSPGLLALTGGYTIYDDYDYRSFRYVVAEVWELLWDASRIRRSDVPPCLPFVVNKDEVRLYQGDKRRPVTGDGADMLRRWVRFGDAHLGIAADWIEENPYCVDGMTEAEVRRASKRLRRAVGM